jgi:hypothetical protein
VPWVVCHITASLRHKVVGGWIGPLQDLTVGRLRLPGPLGFRRRRWPRATIHSLAAQAALSRAAA